MCTGSVNSDIFNLGIVLAKVKDHREKRKKEKKKKKKKKGKKKKKKERSTYIRTELRWIQQPPCTFCELSEKSAENLTVDC